MEGKGGGKRSGCWLLVNYWMTFKMQPMILSIPRKGGFFFSSWLDVQVGKKRYGSIFNNHTSD